MQPTAAEELALDPRLREQVDELVRRRVDELWQAKLEEEAARPRKIAIIATKGTLDWAYPPLILATTAAALGWEAGIFFTFYGLTVIHKDKHRGLKVAPLGNPAMPMPVPNLIGALPGMTPAATTMMKRMFQQNGVASIDDLLALAVDAGVKLFPCGMTMQVFGFKPEDFIEGSQPVCGAAHFLEYARDAHVSLLI